MLTQPFILGGLISFIENGGDERDYIWGIKDGFILALLLTLSATLLSILMNSGFYLVQRAALSVRNALMGMLLDKSLLLSASSRFWFMIFCLIIL